MISASELANYFGKMLGSLKEFRAALASGENTLLLHKDEAGSRRVRLRWIGEKRGETSSAVNTSLTRQDDEMAGLEKAARLILNGKFIVETFTTAPDGTKTLSRIAPETEKEEASRIKVPNFEDTLSFLTNEEMKTILESVEAAVVEAHKKAKDAPQTIGEAKKEIDAPEEPKSPPKANITPETTEAPEVPIEAPQAPIALPKASAAFEATKEEEIAPEVPEMPKAKPKASATKVAPEELETALEAPLKEPEEPKSPLKADIATKTPKESESIPAEEISQPVAASTKKKPSKAESKTPEQPKTDVVLEVPEEKSESPVPEKKSTRKAKAASTEVDDPPRPLEI